MGRIVGRTESSHRIEVLHDTAQNRRVTVLTAGRTMGAPSFFALPIRGPVLLLTPSSLPNQIAHRQIDDLVTAAIEHGFERP